MNRIYRALENAEKENHGSSKEKRLGKDPSLMVFKEGAPPEKEELILRYPGEGGETSEFFPEGQRPILIAPPDSLAAEQFRKLRTQIFLHSPDPPHSILVTSAGPREGKTIVSVNLAIAISQELHKKAILIDGDMRKPNIHLTKHENSKGLSNYLSNQTTLQEILVHLEEDNLWIIPAGSPSRKSSELIGSKKMGELLKSLRELGEETYIIIDSPPILSTSEPILLSKMVDGVILVIMGDRTPREPVQRAVSSIDRQKIVGVVFNQKELKTMGRYSDYYYKRYHRK